jgi:predicted phosphodiesterase
LSEVLYLGRFAFTLAALFFVVNIAFSSFLITQIVVLLSNNDEYKAYGSLSNFNFAASGDWGCNGRAVNTVNNIVNKNPELVLGLGDFSYQDTADCWFEIIAPLDDKMKITIGNHDDETTSLLNQYMSHFNLTKQFYSFNYQNVHFTVISTELLKGSEVNEQYEFVNTDLASAASDPNIDWIVVYYHTEAYTSPWVAIPNGQNVHTGLIRLRDAYHPLFEKYHVDLVLQGDNHNYQRSYPIKYNNANSSSPIITDVHTNNYSNPEGQIFVTAGTGGRSSYGFLAKEPYMVTQYVGYGFLNIDVIDNGQTFNATFYSNDDGDMKDQFSITKNGSASADTNTWSRLEG